MNSNKNNEQKFAKSRDFKNMIKSLVDLAMSCLNLNDIKNSDEEEKKYGGKKEKRNKKEGGNNGW